MFAKSQRCWWVYKMKTLKTIVDEYITRPEEWLYYQKNVPNTFFNNGKSFNRILEDPDDAMQFIKDYFYIGDKTDALVKIDLDRLREKAENRFIHIVSTFFLGLKIAECFGVCTAVRDEKNMSFQYKWFLACLYHDLGYCYEKDCSCSDVRMLSVDGLDAIQEICNIKYLDNREFITYSRAEIDTYLKGRATCKDGKHGVIDHGIVGGTLLYDALRKQFEMEWIKHINANESRKSFYSSRGLHYSNEHFETYAEIADAIIAHNVWPETFAEYTGYANLRKITFSNTLCFILGVADTVEPLKRNKKYADRVRFDFGNKFFKIYTDEVVFKNVYSTIEKMKDWLDVAVVANDRNFSVSIAMLP